MYRLSGLILGLALLSSAIAQIQYGESDEGYAYKKSGTPFNSGYTQDCQGDDKLCVARENCVNGFVRNIQGIAKIRNQNRKCEANQEVCCNLRTGDDAESSNVIVSKTGGLFDSVEDDEQEVNNGYLPPKDAEVPDSSVDRFSNLPLPRPDPVDEGRIDLGPQIGCAAALLCVPEQRCNAIGMIVEQDIFFTEEEQLRRVPMVDCINPETGIQGKCCRDPNYKDPWPAQPIPKDYNGGFDQQGFPKIWNLTYTTPASRVRPVAQPSNFQQTKRPENIPARPNQIPNSNQPRPFAFPTQPNQPIGAPSFNEPVTEKNYKQAPAQATQRPPVNAGQNLGPFVPVTRPPPQRLPSPTFAAKQPVAVPQQPLQLSTDVRDFINPHQPGKKCGLINQGSIKDCQ